MFLKRKNMKKRSFFSKALFTPTCLGCPYLPSKHVLWGWLAEKRSRNPTGPSLVRAIDSSSHKRSRWSGTRAAVGRVAGAFGTSATWKTTKNSCTWASKYPKLGRVGIAWNRCVADLVTGSQTSRGLGDVKMSWSCLVNTFHLFLQILVVSFREILRNMAFISEVPWFPFLCMISSFTLCSDFREEHSKDHVKNIKSFFHGSLKPCHVLSF